MKNGGCFKTGIAALIFIILIAYLLGGITIITYFFGGGKKVIIEDQMQKVENKVAIDAVDQYNIAARQGDQMQMYTQASLVCAAYLQAKDEPNYNKWKVSQDSLAKEIGLQ